MLRRRMGQGTVRDPLVSVVIPTRDRRPALERTLSAVASQVGIAPSEFEVVVADDGSKDDTPAYLAAARDQAPFALRVVTLGGSGPARARNRAIEEARGGRVLLLGDDTRPEPDVLARHVARAAGREVGVQGLVEWDSEDVITPVMAFLAPEGPQFYFRGLRDGENVPYTSIYGANYSAPTAWFRDEPFHEGFPHAAFEDTELAYRFRKKGRRTIFAATAVCRHRHRYDSIEPFLTRQRRAGEAARFAVGLHRGLLPRVALGPALVGAAHAVRYLVRRVFGAAEDAERWDLRARLAFFRGFLAGRALPRPARP